MAAVYRHALPQVYGYLLPRCGNTAVAEVAAYLGRSEPATETLLVRARATLRRIYREESSGDA